MRWLVFMCALCAVANAASPSPFAIAVPAPGPDVFADEVLQQAIDKAAAQGGGVVELGPGEFKLSRHAGDETLVLKSGIILRGQGYATHIFLDPKTPPNPARYYPVRIGTETTPASNVVIEHLRYTGNNAKIGGGSIMGFNARLGDPSSLLLSCDHITVRNCWIFDAQQAAGCTKDHIINYSSDERQAEQFKDWQVYHNVIDTCGNKAVELAECNGGLIADNHISNVKDGPQVIFGSRNVQIRDNDVHYLGTGINITEGSNHIRVSGNHAEPAPDINPSIVGSCLIFRTEPQALNSIVSDIVITGNIFRNQITKGHSTVRFHTRKEALSCTYQAITMTGNVFDGDVQFLDKTTPARTTIQDIIFADNICEGDIVSEPRKVMNTRRIMMRGNQLRKPSDYELHANDWIWSGNSHTGGSLTVTSEAKGNVIHDNVTTSPITDHGVNTDSANNVVRPHDR